jgi:hypothetical protein
VASRDLKGKDAGGNFHPMELEAVVQDIADVLKGIDSSQVPFKRFQPGVGPYGEPQLVKLIAEGLNRTPRYGGCAKIMRTPDLMLAGHWALEIKLARPFGDNGKLAENWSVNLLHPYPGNTSLLGDCLKLQGMTCSERKAVIAIGYEHDPAQVSLEPLWKSFEVVAEAVLNIKLGTRVEVTRDDLIHSVHQRLRVVAWKVS